MTPQEFALIMAFSAENPEESRAIFNQARDAAEAAGDIDQAAKFELVREYACNPEFRSKYQDYVFNVTR